MNTHLTILNDVKMSSICGQSAWVFIVKLIPNGFRVIQSLILNQINGPFGNAVQQNPSETTRSAFLTTLAYKRVSGITSKNSNLNLEWLVVVTDGNDTLH